ncbi:MAG: spermidine synthase [Alphaproteobacteria bacterium]|nr:spermidine synthase [Alphaproteobacteria bacterium]
MRFLPVLFSIAMFGAALLSFSVQPILGKMMLPMVGGAPAGWIVAMAFFQLALLAGYGISYALGKFSAWVHSGGLLLLYIAGFTFLPPHLPQISSEIQGAALSLAVVKALAQTIFVPFLALTATTAAMQRVFAATTHPTAQDPYYLFVASNLGSFVGLLAYPFFLEPFSGLQFQADSWRGIYIAVVGVILAATIAAWIYRSRQDKSQMGTEPGTVTEPVSKRQILNWIILSFIPCSLSMGVTTMITTDVGGLPLFWVVPLGLYLLTFILAFAKKTVIATKTLGFYHLIAGVLMVLALGKGIAYNAGFEIVTLFASIFALLAVFFVIAWHCHQKLAESRPKTAHLTLFYFIVALGGGLAGICHAFILPFVLTDLVEFPAMVLLSLLLLDASISKTEKNRKLLKVLLAMIVLAIPALWAGKYFEHQHYPKIVSNAFLAIFFITAIFCSIKPRWLFILGVVALVISTKTHYPGNVIAKGRNFFGVYIVFDNINHGRKLRYMVHGNTLHGLELLEAKNTSDINYSSYYGRDNPINSVLELNKVKTIGVIGLGSGQMACRNPELTMDFYEIDPEIRDTAKAYFSYLTRCPPRDIFIGDGRLMMEKENRKYDMIVLDAFSSDGIPLHLVTREALEVYKSHLTEHGVILFHVSNRFLDLAPPLGAVANSVGLEAYSIFFTPDNKKYPLSFMSKWVVFLAEEKDRKALEKAGWAKAPVKGKAWTDDQSSLLDALPWFSH